MWVVPALRWVGDRALLRAFDGSTAVANASARALARAVSSFEEVEDAVPGAASLLVILRSGVEPSQGLTDLCEAFEAGSGAGIPSTVHDVEVRYDGEDLGAVASFCGLPPADIVRLHSEAAFTVAFVGFSPGFAYLLGLPEALRMPRLETPRTRVPAGSVAIAGEWSAVYPTSTPGGWSIIGRTDAVLFDARREPPATLAPGDRVRFVPR